MFLRVGSQKPGVCVSGRAAEGVNLCSAAPTSQCWERPLDGAGESAVRESPSSGTQFAHSQTGRSSQGRVPGQPFGVEGKWGQPKSSASPQAALRSSCDAWPPAAQSAA